MKRIVAVRTTQRDISAMRLQEAKQRTQHAHSQLEQAEQQLLAASQSVGAGARLTPLDLERMDVARVAAWEEIALWQVHKENAQRAEERARSQVEVQHLRLRQSERLGERAEQLHKKRITSAERQLHDEQASRAGREPR